jgi:hypothetical protein
MNLIPLSTVGNIRFDITQDELESAIGKPMRQGRNRRGEEEFFYPKVIYRFDDLGLVEVTLDVEAITIAGEKIGFNSLPDFLKTNDAQAEESVGFFFSPRYGIAVDPHFKSWVTLMSSRRVRTWSEVANQGAYLERPRGAGETSGKAG